ncbi:50S ribosomal protein L34 [Thalictrum thalictroides]|uniref:50S ribosomal protein L34 n=1 Tax=Thalictrum thalictroides TaxID=46969 RepID=A0A7J6UX46_THATH|nr:50S ribosomal protein L34 [Thalictrum thalictroides]
MTAKAISLHLLQPLFLSSSSSNQSVLLSNQKQQPIFRVSLKVSRATTPQTTTMESSSNKSKSSGIGVDPSLKLLFVEMGVGYDQHGQDITVAAMRACKDAISSNSIPAFRRGSIPGVSFEEMKLQIKLGVPRPVQEYLDIDRVKSVFPYGKILNVDVVDGGLICSSGVHVEEMGDKNDDCYIVNAAVYVGY